MNEIRVRNKVKAVVKRIVNNQPITGQDMRALVRFQSKDLEALKLRDMGETLNELELTILTLHIIENN